MKRLAICLLLTSCQLKYWPLTKLSFEYEGIEISIAISASTKAIQSAVTSISGIPTATK